MSKELRRLKERLMRKKIVDDEYITIRNKSLESERKLFSVLEKIREIKEHLHEIATIQIDFSYAMKELSSGKTKICEMLDGFKKIAKELSHQQEEYENIIEESLEIPISNFLKQFTVLSEREIILKKRRKEMQRYKHRLKVFSNYSTSEFFIKMKNKFEMNKNNYFELRNELKNDRLRLIECMPFISKEIGRIFMKEGWGCLFIKNELWEEIKEIEYEGHDEKTIQEYCTVITDSFYSKSNQSNNQNDVKLSNCRVKVVFDYNPKNSNELKIRKGDYITLLSSDGNWWKGECNGKIGLFPSNYVVKDI